MSALSKTEDEHLKNVDSHFSFGENWSSYLEVVSEKHVAEAAESLTHLLTTEEIGGKSLLDIGCGSGLSMLAALKLGVKHVSGIDIDPNSVATAQKLLTERADGQQWHVDNKSVFDLDPAADKQYDIVHSWGVLHHTGAMTEALEKAAAMVAPQGLFVVALYRKNPSCRFWRAEKKLYTNAPRPVQMIISFIYKAAFLAGVTAKGKNPVSYLRNYMGKRGMNWHHDIIDWLGGYPYESVLPEEMDEFFQEHDFSNIRRFVKKPHLWGLLGTHCDEYVAQKN